MIEYEIFEAKIEYYFKKYDICHSEAMTKNFYVLADHLLLENEKYNLTSITDIDEIIVKHYIDSIMPLKYFEIPKNAKMIDIGTGAGFPALPLHIMRGDLQITFLDSKNKKINFVKNAAEKMNGDPKKLTYHLGRAEQYAKTPGIKETYEIAVFRAVAKLPALCELAAPFLGAEGFFVAYKGKNAETEMAEAQNTLKNLNLKITETAKFDLENEKRTLIKIEKTKKSFT